MLSVVTRDEANEIIKEHFGSYHIESEKVNISSCLGRILSEDVLSKENIPSFNRSTVDGFAVMARETYGSSESLPCQLTVEGEILMGEECKIKLSEGRCVKISTGGMLPEGADAVVMVEYTDSEFDELCLIYKAVSPWENVTRKGDDVKENDVVLKKGTHITSRHIGVLASLGISEVWCRKKIKVGIISTGDEIVPIEKTPQTGQVRDINTHILSALMKELHCITIEYPAVKDEYEKIYSLLKTASEECDIVLISGGSSAGARDMTLKIISELGESYLHGIAMKPGKPTIVGNIGGKAIFGLPGHPAAAYYVALSIVKPLIEMLYAVKDSGRKISLPISTNISSNHGREEIISVKISKGVAEPIFFKSGIVSLLASADGYIRIERNTEGIKKGETVEINLFGE